MSVGTILLIVLVLLLVGVIPAWPHSRGWGYGPRADLAGPDHSVDPQLLAGKI